MIFIVAVVLTGAGVIACWVAAGLARTTERVRCYEECERRLGMLRNQFQRGRP